MFVAYRNLRVHKLSFAVWTKEGIQWQQANQNNNYNSDSHRHPNPTRGRKSYPTRPSATPPSHPTPPRARGPPKKHKGMFSRSKCLGENVMDVLGRAGDIHQGRLNLDGTTKVGAGGGGWRASGLARPLAHKTPLLTAVLTHDNERHVYCTFQKQTALDEIVRAGWTAASKVCPSTLSMR